MYPKCQVRQDHPCWQWAVRRSAWGASPEAGHRTWRRHWAERAPGRRHGRPVDLTCPSAQAQIKVICRAPDPPAGPAVPSPRRRLRQSSFSSCRWARIPRSTSARAVRTVSSFCSASAAARCCPSRSRLLADDPADLLVARGPVPAGRWRPAGRARHIRQRRHPEGLVLVRAARPRPSGRRELVEHRVEGMRLGDPSVRLPDVQDRVGMTSLSTWLSAAIGSSRRGGLTRAPMSLAAAARTRPSYRVTPSHAPDLLCLCHGAPPRPARPNPRRISEQTR